MIGLGAGPRSALGAAGAIILWLGQPVLQTQGTQPADPGRPTFRAGVETVVVSVTVRDRTNHLVTTLARDDFRLLIDGRPVEVEIFSHQRRPLMLGVLLSTRPESGVARMRDVARALVDAIEPAEHAAIGTFAHEIAITPFATSDRAVLNRVLDEDVWPGIGGNPVSTAVAAMVDALPKERGKPVVVVAGSDFAESCGLRPCVAHSDALDLAQREHAVVYGVVNRTTQPPTQVGAFPVAKLSEATGGGYIFLNDRDDVRAVMKQVAEELRHEYLLGFTPAVADDREHTAKVEVVPPGHRATARVTRKAGQR
jgi:Ca-activated chloride channel family protein